MEANEAEVLARIEARLERIERAVGRIDELAGQAPGVVAVAADVLDEWAARDGRADERLRAAVHLVDRLSRPEVLAALTTLVEQVEAAPGLVAMLGEVVDEIARRAEEDGVDLHDATANLGEALRGLVLLASRPGVVELLGAIDDRTLDALSSVARSMKEAGDGEPRSVGLFGALGAMRDPDVRRALGYALTVAEGFGRGIGEGS